MAQSIKAKLDVKNGPGKFDLMLGLFERKIVYFFLSNGCSVGCQILSIQQEDGSCNSWNIAGFVVNDNSDFEGYYTTKKNTGFLMIESRVQQNFAKSSFKTKGSHASYVSLFYL